MFSKSQAALALFCLATYAAAGTTVLGTASARGPLRVDGYTVQGDATVFNGSVVETQDASAELRVEHGVDITLSKSSQGTLYNHRFVLKRGATEIAAPGSFELQANGLHVMARKPHSVGIVALTPQHAVKVAALSGSFEVRDRKGVLLSEVLPGHPLAFAKQSQADANEAQTNANQSQTTIAPQFFPSMVGLLSFEKGHFYLTSRSDEKFELIGKQKFQKYEGDKVVVSGNFEPVALPEGAVGTIAVQTIEINGGNHRKAAPWLITGAALGAAGTVGFVIHNALNPPASR